MTQTPDASRALGRARELVIAALIGVCALPALLQLGELASILWSRIDYAYDVHWMDGSSLLHAHRLMHGKNLYPPPSTVAGFLPNCYPPGLYVFLAIAGGIFGLDYKIGRVVAIAATAICAALLTRDVYRRFRGFPAPWLPALLTAGAIAAGFPVTGGWYDATMPDPLALMLAVVAGQRALASSETPKRHDVLLVPALMWMTLYTKQSYAALILWQLAFLYRSNRRFGLLVGAIFSGLSGVTLAIAHYVTHGGFLLYAVIQLWRQPTVPARLWEASLTLVRFAPYIPLIFAGAIFLRVKRALSQSVLFWTGMLAASLILSTVSYSKQGGWDNNLMSVVVLAPAAAFGVLSDVCRLVGPRTSRLAVLATTLGAAVYLMLRLYPARPFLATKRRSLAALELNRYVAGMRGDVLIPARPFLAIRHGTPVEQVNVMAWFDAWISRRRDLTFDDFMRKNGPRWVLLADQEPAAMIEAMARDYHLRGPMPAETWPAQTLEAHDQDPSDDGIGRLHWVLERNDPDPGPASCLFEFESTRYDGWTAKGDAFASGPFYVDSQRGTLFAAIQGTIVGVVGNSVATSYSRTSGERARGTLESPTFTINRERIRLRVAGSGSPRARVELRVGGQLRQQAVGRGNNFMEEVEWYVGDERGKDAQLCLVDEDEAAHILIDHVCLVGNEPQ